MSCWNSKFSKFFSASLNSFVSHFGQYGLTWMTNMICLCKHTILIPRLPCLFRMAKAVSSTVELVNSVTSDSVSLFNFVIWAFPSKCFLTELVPYTDEWRRTWWRTIYMIPGLLVSSIPQCKLNRHEGAFLELFLAIGLIKPTFIQSHQASKMICKVRSFKSRIKTLSFLEEIITFNKLAFKDFKSKMAVGIRKLGNSSRKSAESHDTV